MMYTINNRIYISKKDQVISNLNEIITLLTVYHLFCFTDFVDSNETKAFAVGNSMMFITLINLIINIGPILPDIGRSIKLRVRKCRMWRI